MSGQELEGILFFDNSYPLTPILTYPKNLLAEHKHFLAHEELAVGAQQGEVADF